MAILRARDENGNIIEIPAIKGEKGDKGDSGTTNYNDLENKPFINGQELVGNITLDTKDEIYIGNDEPDGYALYIDPTGEASSVVEDIQIDGTSVVQNGVANIPMIGHKDGVVNYDGLVHIPKGYGLGVQYNTNNLIIENPDTLKYIDNRNTTWQSAYYALTVKNIDKAVRLAMGDGKGEAWTSEEKASARDRMGMEWRYIGKVETTEDVASMVMNIDENGQPFSLRKVRILFTNKPNSVNSTTWVALLINKEWGNGGLFNNGIVDGIEYITELELEIVGDRLFTNHAYRSHNTTSVSTCMTYPTLGYVYKTDVLQFSHDSINEVKIYSPQNAIGSGSYFEVWGVDA